MMWSTTGKTGTTAWQQNRHVTNTLCSHRGYGVTLAPHSLGTSAKGHCHTLTVPSTAAVSIILSAGCAASPHTTLLCACRVDTTWASTSSQNRMRPAGITAKQ